MTFPLRSHLLVAALVFVFSALTATAQLLRFSGSGSFVGADGPLPEGISAEGGVTFEFVFVEGQPPVARTPNSKTYTALYAWIQLSGSERYHLLKRPTVTISRDAEYGEYAYFLHGQTHGGWNFGHYAYSDHPGFVPDNLKLPRRTPTAPIDAYAAGYVDLWGPDYVWHAYSDSQQWFTVRRLF